MARVVRVYRSSDTSAPVLTGVAGAFVGLLDAVLVNGYGTRDAAGWTIPYTGTNLRVYRNSTTDGSGAYYRVKDDYTSTNQRYAAVSLYETMSDISTGTLSWPGAHERCGQEKSATQDSTPRDWVIVADNVAAHILIRHGSNGSDWEYGFIGDIFSFVPSDPYAGAIIMRGNNSTAITSMTFTLATQMQHRTIANGDGGMGIVRAHTGSGGGVSFGLHTDNVKAMTTPAGNVYFGSSSFNALAYPNAVNSGILLAPIWVHQLTTSPYIVRGLLPGVWSPLHNRPLSNNDTFAGVGSLSGKTFEAFNIYSNAQIMLETSNTWSM